MYADETDDQQRIVTTVFELAGEDQSGLLADVTHLLTTNGCDVRSAAVSVQHVNCCATKPVLSVITTLCLYLVLHAFKY